MTGDWKIFTSFENGEGENEKITFGDNSKGKVIGLGKIAISNDLSISNVSLVESLNFNLLSVAQICDLGLFCSFSQEGVSISNEKDNSLVFKDFWFGNLYLVDFSSSDSYLKTCLIAKTSLGWLWHRRLAHVGMIQLKKLFKHDLVVGLKDVKFEKDKLCSACQAGKQVASSHPSKSIMSTSRSFELLRNWVILDSMESLFRGLHNPPIWFDHKHILSNQKAQLQRATTMV